MCIQHTHTHNVQRTALMHTYIPQIFISSLEFSSSILLSLSTTQHIHPYNGYSGYIKIIKIIMNGRRERALKSLGKTTSERKNIIGKMRWMRQQRGVEWTNERTSKQKTQYGQKSENKNKKMEKYLPRYLQCMPLIDIHIKIRLHYAEIWSEQTMIADLMYWYFTISYYMCYMHKLHFIQSHINVWKQFGNRSENLIHKHTAA